MNTDSNELNMIQSEEEAMAKAEKLPKWVKCSACGERPKLNDWLIEVVPNSSALLHQSCAQRQGKVAGLNLGIDKGTK